MDLSALLDPILRIAAQIQQRSHGTGNSNNPSLTLDRALGTVASLSLTIGLCKLLSSANKNNRHRGISDDGDDGDGGDGARRERGTENQSDELTNLGGGVGGVYELVRIILRRLLMGRGIQRIEVNNSRNGNRNSKNDRNRNENTARRVNSNSEELSEMEMTNLMGSCHCRSVCFMLKAPKHITAQDCHGKIRYPHHITHAQNFQLVSGTEYLSVYYVNLSQEEHGRYDAQHDGNLIAAHTFCSRCGVHILRAPNSHSDELEINTNCLDEVRERSQGGGSGSGRGPFMTHAQAFGNGGSLSMEKEGVELEVTPVKNPNGMGLGSGRAAMEFMHKVQYEKTLIERDQNDAKSVLEFGKLASLGGDEEVYNNNNNNNNNNNDGNANREDYENDIDDALSMDGSAREWGHTMAEKWGRQPYQHPHPYVNINQQQDSSHPATPLTIPSSIQSESERPTDDSLVSESEVSNAGANSDGLSYDGSAEGRRAHARQLLRNKRQRPAQVTPPLPSPATELGSRAVGATAQSYTMASDASSFSLPKISFDADNRSITSASTIGNGSVMTSRTNASQTGFSLNMGKLATVKSHEKQIAENSTASGDRMTISMAEEEQNTKKKQLLPPSNSAAMKQQLSFYMRKHLASE
uniref:CENP-V/GFA domain-containing protein n=1 Tax=Chaetoceros debilis TaxID=122233 RepID=A0A7S3Q6J0_9STRA